MSTAASGTSRRGFLGRAAGTAVAVAGAGVGAGAFTQSAAAASQRSYTAGHFALELDGVSCGKFVGLDGGQQRLAVAQDGLGPDYYTKKHIAGVKYEDFTMQIGSGMSKSFYNWMKDSFDKGAIRKNGSVVSADFNYNEKRRSQASAMFITEVTIPALDASSKDPAYLAVKLAVERITVLPSSGAPVQARKQKAWLPANFVFEIDGMDTSRVASIDSFTWKCSIAPDGSPVFDVSDIALEFPVSSLSSWQEWFRSLASGADDERDGALTIVGAENGAVITFPLHNLGLFSLYKATQGKTGKTKLAREGRMRAEMYCERMRVLPTVNK